MADLRLAGGAAASAADRPEAQRIHDRHRPCAHRKNVAQYAANAGRGALERLDKRRMIVRFDLERACPAVADVDDAGVLARSLYHQLAARGQPLEMHPRRLIGAMLAPHDAENAQLRHGWLAAKPLQNLLVLIGSNTVIPNDLGRDLWLYGGIHRVVTFIFARSKKNWKSMLAVGRKSEPRQQCRQAQGAGLRSTKLLKMRPQNSGLTARSTSEQKIVQASCPRIT